MRRVNSNTNYLQKSQSKAICFSKKKSQDHFYRQPLLTTLRADNFRCKLPRFAEAAIPCLSAACKGSCRQVSAIIFGDFNFERYAIQRGAFDSAKNHKLQRRKRQSVTAKRAK